MEAFKRTVWSYYRTHGRHDLPWRRDTSPYAIIVSEIMLQQTQVPRVIRKFESWMRRFPDWQTLSRASTTDILREWSGLGYNRRALYLMRIAEAVTARPEAFAFLVAKNRPKPQASALTTLPGIGPNTAGAILAYAFNEPHPFIETNIRSAYIHFFFPKSRTKIPDSRLMPLIEATLADPRIRSNPRKWHWALMDYGSHLKNTRPNPSRKSAHHVRQSAFKGSNRELRANILKALLKQPMKSSAIVRLFSDKPVMQVKKNLAALAAEGFLAEKPGASGTYRIV